VPPGPGRRAAAGSAGHHAPVAVEEGAMHRRCSTSLLLSLGMLLLPVAARPQVPDASPAPLVAGAAPDAPAARLSALEAENAALRTALAQLEDSRVRLAVREQRLAALQAPA